MIFAIFLINTWNKNNFVKLHQITIHQSGCTSLYLYSFRNDRHLKSATSFLIDEKCEILLFPRIVQFNIVFDQFQTKKSYIDALPLIMKLLVTSFHSQILIDPIMIRNNMKAGDEKKIHVKEFEWNLSGLWKSTCLIQIDIISEQMKWGTFKL